MRNPRFINPRRWLFGRHRRNPVIRLIARQCEKVCRAYDNNDYYLYRNGESRVIEKLLRGPWRGRVPVLLDVGANFGEWSTMVLDLSGDVELHVFEIVPDTFSVLKANLDARPAPAGRLALNGLGLHSVSGPVRVWANNGANSAGLMAHPDAAGNSSILAEAIRGDDYLQRAGLDHVDYLKLDIEGGEYDVLLGFADALAEGRIDVVQFEYGPFNIPARRLLIDFHELLGRHGYAVGKIFPDHVEFGAYHTGLETLQPGNFLAVAPGFVFPAT